MSHGSYVISVDGAFDVDPIDSSVPREFKTHRQAMARVKQLRRRLGVGHHIYIYSVTVLEREKP